MSLAMLPISSSDSSSYATFFFLTLSVFSLQGVVIGRDSIDFFSLPSLCFKMLNFEIIFFTEQKDFQKRASLIQAYQLWDNQRLAK